MMLLYTTISSLHLVIKHLPASDDLVGCEKACHASESHPLKDRYTMASNASGLKKRSTVDIDGDVTKMVRSRATA